MSEYPVRAVFKARDLWSKRLDKMSASTARFNFGLNTNLKRVNKYKQEWREATAPVTNFGRAAARTTAVVSVAAGAALKDIVDEGGEFEQTMKGAVTKFGGMSNVGVQEFEKMKRAALDVGADTEASAAQAAGALKFMAMAGEDPAVAMEVLGDAADFATSGQAELARATDIMSDAMGPLMGNVEGAENRVAAYRETMDLMTHATTRGNMGLEEMFEATKMGAAGFRGAGQDIEQFTASVAVLSNAGIKGSKAGKDLQRMMISLTAPSKKAAKLMRRVKFDPVNKDGTIKDFNVIMTEMKRVTSAMDEEGRSKFLAEVIGKNSMASALALMDNASAIKTLADEAAEATGMTAEQAKEMRDTTEGMLKGMSSAFSSVKLEIFEVVKDDVKEIVKDVTAWAKLHKGDIAEGVKDFIGFVKDNREEIVFWGKAIGAAAVAFVAVEAAIGGVKVALVGWKFITAGTQAVTALSTGLGDATKGVRLLGQGYGGAYPRVAKMNEAFNKLSPTMRGATALAGLAGAAFVGWQVGKLINELTGADTALAGLMVRMDGFLALADRVNERSATNTQDEFLARQKDDLKQLKEAYEQGSDRQVLNAFGLGDVEFFTDQHTADEIARQEALIGKLEEKKRLRSQGVDTDRSGAVEVFRELESAKALLAEAEVSGNEHQVTRYEELVSTAEENLRANQNPEAFRHELDTGPTTAAPSPNEPPPPNSVSAGDEMVELARQQIALMMQTLDEQRKANANPNKVDVTVRTPGGGSVESQSGPGSVQVERTGALP